VNRTYTEVNLNMFLATLSDPVLLAIIGGAVTIFGGGVTITLALIAKRVSKVSQTVDTVHFLVNSSSLVQLRLYTIAARRIADLTNAEADIEAAMAAEKLLVEHELKAKNLKS